MSSYSECEAGYTVEVGTRCQFCGRTSSQNCGKAAPDARDVEIKRLKGDLKFAYEMIVSLRNELATYKEREKTMGWSQD